MRHGEGRLRGAAATADRAGAVGELALRSDDLEEILAEACRLAGEALRTDLAKETRNSIFPDLGGAPKGVSPGKDARW